MFAEFWETSAKQMQFNALFCLLRLCYLLHRLKTADGTIISYGCHWTIADKYKRKMVCFMYLSCILNCETLQKSDVFVMLFFFVSSVEWKCMRLYKSQVKIYLLGCLFLHCTLSVKKKNEKEKKNVKKIVNVAAQVF